MKTNIHPVIKEQAEAAEAEAILRSCVHCGFCNATCPTYQLLGDERDGPRGRIYLIKQFLEKNTISAHTQTHLDRCLTCRSCETTCPSGVKYSRLIDIGRNLMEQQLPRSISQRVFRWLVRQVIPYPNRFSPLLKVAQTFRPLLPSHLAKKVPLPQLPQHKTAGNTASTRVMLALAGCVQSSATPNTLQATTHVLAKLGITLTTAPKAGCCGALSYHMSAREEGLTFMRNNIDAWWPSIEQGAEAIVITASGCGAMVKEYGEHLKDDPVYATKAAKVAAITQDISEVLLNEDLSKLTINTPVRTAFHCPCSLQHALKLNNHVETIFNRLGIELLQTKDKHLCCGSAGTYSLMQPEISQQLLDKKIEALSIEQPDQIITANVGCQLHLTSKATIPVKHWIELLD